MSCDFKERISMTMHYNYHNVPQNIIPSITRMCFNPTQIQKLSAQTEISDQVPLAPGINITGGVLQRLSEYEHLDTVVFAGWDDIGKVFVIQDHDAGAFWSIPLGKTPRLKDSLKRVRASM
jgi:hypothetical protein